MDKIPNRGPQIVCSGFIEKDNKFLVFLCPCFKVWRVPGGKAEYGERIEETLFREMKEEIGIEIRNPRFLGYGQDRQFHFKKNKETSRLVMYFHFKIDQEPKVGPEEAEEHRWVTLEELKNIKDKEGALTDFFRKNPDFTPE